MVFLIAVVAGEVQRIVHLADVPLGFDMIKHPLQICHHIFIGNCFSVSDLLVSLEIGANSLFHIIEPV